MKPLIAIAYTNCKGLAKGINRTTGGQPTMCAQVISHNKMDSHRGLYLKLGSGVTV